MLERLSTGWCAHCTFQKQVIRRLKTNIQRLLTVENIINYQKNMQIEKKVERDCQEYTFQNHLSKMLKIQYLKSINKYLIQLSNDKN